MRCAGDGPRSREACTRHMKIRECALDHTANAATKKSPRRVTESDGYINACAMEILCRALPTEDYEQAWDAWLDWYPKNRTGWFHWSRAFGAFLWIWREKRSELAGTPTEQEHPR